MTPASARLIETLDGERIALGRALGVEVVPDPELGLRQGYLSEATYLKGYNQGIGFAGSRAPSSLEFRYLTEDVPYGLVFTSELAKEVGVPTPGIDAVITLASIVLGTDFRAQGKRLPRDLGWGTSRPNECGPCRRHGSAVAAAAQHLRQALGGGHDRRGVEASGLAGEPLDRTGHAHGRDDLAVG